MNTARNLFLFLSIALIPFFTGCASTSGSASQTVTQSWYYDPASPDRNEGYFANVKSHFERIGAGVPESELREYTAARYITSTPPNADVYVGTRRMGRTNRGDLYFKPGQYTVEFSVNSGQWTEILTFTEGRNASLMVRKP